MISDAKLQMLLEAVGLSEYRVQKAIIIGSGSRRSNRRHFFETHVQCM